jgi:hypothetical protein
MPNKTIAQKLMDAVRQADAAFAAAQTGDPAQRAFQFAHIIGCLQGSMKMAVIEGGYDPSALIGGNR